MDLAGLVHAAVTPGRVLRAPLLHFLALGALLHGVLGLRPQTVALDGAALAELDAQWWRETGRAPAPHEQAAMRRRAADEEMLVREALRLGLHARDPVVRARLLRNIALISAAPPTDASVALAHAERLDMAARDVLARRRLVQLMEARLSRGDAPLTRAELEAHVASHPQRYAAPPRASFEHVFFGADARRAEAAMRAGAADDAPRTGQAFAAGSRFASVPEGRIDALFGGTFAATVASAPLGRWVPATSAFGTHLVRVTGREPASPASAQQAGSAAVWGALEERERTALREGIARLRGRYRIVIGDPA